MYCFGGGGGAAGAGMLGLRETVGEEASGGDAMSALLTIFSRLSSAGLGSSLAPSHASSLRSLRRRNRLRIM